MGLQNDNNGVAMLEAQQSTLNHPLIVYEIDRVFRR